MSYKRPTMALALAVVLASSGLLIAGGSQQSFAQPGINLQKQSSSVMQHVQNDGTLTIDTIDLFFKKRTSKTDGEITVEILQDSQTLASQTLSTDDLSHRKFAKVTLDIGIQVTGDFDIKVSFDGKGGIKVAREKAKVSPIDGWLVGKRLPKNWNLKLAFNSENTEDTSLPPPQSQHTGQITMYAYRIPSSYWGDTFTGANAQMYFVVYDSTGALIGNGFADEDGKVISDLDSGATYWIYPTDCDQCHGGDHSVVFNHWEDGSTERPRAVVAQDSGVSAGAYYEYVPPPSDT